MLDFIFENAQLEFKRCIEYITKNMQSYEQSSNQLTVSPTFYPIRNLMEKIDLLIS